MTKSAKKGASGSSLEPPRLEFRGLRSGEWLCVFGCSEDFISETGDTPVEAARNVYTTLVLLEEKSLIKSLVRLMSVFKESIETWGEELGK